MSGNLLRTLEQRSWITEKASKRQYQVPLHFVLEQIVLLLTLDLLDDLYTLLEPDTLTGSNDEKHIVYKRRSTSSRSTSFRSLQMTCNNLKKKFLSVFNSKLSAAQQEFRKSYELVSNANNDRRNQHTAWWAEALQCIEQNKGVSTDL